MINHGLGYADRKSSVLTALPMPIISGSLQEMDMGKLCECGCGEIVKPGNRFIHGHQSVGKIVTDEHRKRISESKRKSSNMIFSDEKKLCECGCGKFVRRRAKFPHDWSRFIHGHNKGNLGNKHSDESKAQMSESQTGRTGWNKGLDLNSLGYVIWNKGKKQSESHRKHNSESHMGNIPWNKGKHWDEDHRERLAKLNIGRIHTEEARFNMGMSHIKPRADGYCDVWSDRVFKRDCRKNFCELCGVSERLSLKVYNRGLLLHHATFNKRECHPWDLQTLCVSCHSSLHHEERRNRMNSETIEERI